MRTHSIIAALAALTFAACATPPPSPTNPPPTDGTAAATSPPTTDAAATAPPPTSLPPPAAGLPAPLYILEAGQIARIEPEGPRRSVLTAERAPLPGMEPIAEFAASRAGALAYIVSDVEADRLVLTDPTGQGAVTLYEQVGHELSDLVFVADDPILLLRLLNNREPPDLPSGVYRLPLGGGPPELLRADDETDDPINPSREVSGYRPVALSPDGTRVLLQVYSLYYEDCGLGVMAADGGEVTRVSLPEGEQVYCGEEAWSADGSAILFLAGKVEGDDAGPRLWQADAATGDAEPLVAEGSFARAPHGMPGGAVRFFLANLVRDENGVVVGATFAPAELAGPGAAPTELAPPFEQRLGLAFWAPDGSSVVVETTAEGERPELRWLPIGGTPVDLPSADADVSQAAWGSE